MVSILSDMEPCPDRSKTTIVSRYDRDRLEQRRCKSCGINVFVREKGSDLFQYLHPSDDGYIGRKPKLNKKPKKEVELELI
jgi:hypothetical protein